VNGDWHTLWTSTVPEDVLPLDESGELITVCKDYLRVKEPPDNNIDANRKWSLQQAAAIVWPCGEIWYSVNGRRMTLKQLGVGPADWHSYSAIEKLIEKGDPINAVKGPAQPPSQGGKNAKAKNKRSSKKGRQIKKQKFYVQASDIESLDTTDTTDTVDVDDTEVS
jgi:hypothetical protein